MKIPKNIKITDAVDKTTAFLSPKSDGLKDCYIDTRLNGESTLEFLLPATSEKIKELTPECQIWAGERVYILLKDDAIDTVRDENNKLWAKIMAVEKWYELNTSYVEPSISNDPTAHPPADLAVIIVGGGNDLSGGRYTVGTAAHALYAILKGSGWNMGVVDVEGIHDLEAEKVSRLELIKMVQKIWGGYLLFDSANKVIHLRDSNEWQPYNGFQIRYRKNLKHITRTQSNKLVTKLYPFGHDDLDIASVNGGKKYIVNNSYTPREYVGIYKNQDIEDPQELLEKANSELELICKPRYLYKVKMVDLRTLPEYSHEDFFLGDMADVIDPDIAPDSPKVRIIKHKYNLFQPWNCELDIGDPEERLIEKLKDSFNTSNFINHAFDGSGKLPGAKLVDESIIRDKIANAAIDATKFDTKQIILVEDKWFNNSPNAGCISWNLHRLFFQGVEYIINSEWTDKKYIVWQKDINKNSYQCYTEKEFNAIKLADDEFVIAVNNNGEHDIAWYSRLARQFIGSTFIADAAIKSAHIAKAQILDAHIANLVANKIVAGVLSSQDNSTWINIDDGSFNFKDSLIWTDGTLNINSPDLEKAVKKNTLYNNVKISPEKGIQVLDNKARERVQIGARRENLGTDIKYIIQDYLVEKALDDEHARVSYVTQGNKIDLTYNEGISIRQGIYIGTDENDTNGLGRIGIGSDEDIFIKFSVDKNTLDIPIKIYLRSEVTEVGKPVETLVATIQPRQVGTFRFWRKPKSEYAYFFIIPTDAVLQTSELTISNFYVFNVKYEDKYGILIRDALNKKTILDEDGILQTWQEGKTDNVDEYKPLKLHVYIPDNTRYISKALLRFRLEPFRAYSTATKDGGNYSVTSQDGGGATASSSSGGSVKTSSGNGGGGYETTTGGIDVSWGTALTHPAGQDNHKHEFKRVVSHGHSFNIPSHSHDIYIPSHSHDVYIPDHSHYVNIPSHSHDIKYGIYESTNANYVKVIINGTNKTSVLGGGSGFEEDKDNLDITPFLSIGQWNTIELESTTLGRIDSTVFIQALMNVE